MARKLRRRDRKIAFTRRRRAEAHRIVGRRDVGRRAVSEPLDGRPTTFDIGSPMVGMFTAMLI